MDIDIAIQGSPSGGLSVSYNHIITRLNDTEKLLIFLHLFAVGVFWLLATVILYTNYRTPKNIDFLYICGYKKRQKKP